MGAPKNTLHSTDLDSQILYQIKVWTQVLCKKFPEGERHPQLRKTLPRDIVERKSLADNHAQFQSRKKTWWIMRTVCRIQVIWWLIQYKGRELMDISFTSVLFSPTRLETSFWQKVPKAFFQKRPLAQSFRKQTAYCCVQGLQNMTFAIFSQKCVHTTGLISISKFGNSQTLSLHNISVYDWSHTCFWIVLWLPFGPVAGWLLMLLPEMDTSNQIIVSVCSAQIHIIYLVHWKVFAFQKCCMKSKFLL